MNKLLFIRIWILLSVIGCLFSCQKLADDEDDETSDAVSALKVTTRSGSSAQIIYPVYLYAFSEEGTCETSQTIASSKSAMELQLSPGKYQIVAISGVSKGYVMPKDPVIDDVIKMEANNYALSPMMMGRADVTLGNGGKNDALTVTLAYMVASVDIALKNVPATASEVKLSFSPVYVSRSMSGEYGGQPSDKVTIDCEIDDEGIWGTNTLYIFPGFGEETAFSIQLKMKDGANHSYSYTYKGVPEANHPFNVIGDYKGDITVGGNLVAKDWESSIDVDFEFGSSEDGSGGESGGDEGGGDDEVDISGVPEVGSIWKDCIVANVSKSSSGGADLLLLSLAEWEGYKTEAEAMISGYTINGINGWRFPTEPEAKILKNRFNGNALYQLNKAIVDMGQDYSEITSDDKLRYLCTKNEIFYSFQFIAGKSVTKAGSKTIYLIRPVAIYHYSK